MSSHSKATQESFERTNLHQNHSAIKWKSRETAANGRQWLTTLTSDAIPSNSSTSQSKLLGRTCTYNWGSLGLGFTSCSSVLTHQLARFTSSSSVLTDQLTRFTSCSSVLTHQLTHLTSCSSVLTHQLTRLTSCSSVLTHQLTRLTSCSSVVTHQLTRFTSSSVTTVIQPIDAHSFPRAGERGNE